MVYMCFGFHPYTLLVQMFRKVYLMFVDCLKITEDKSSENRVYTSDARLIRATRAMSKRGLKARVSTSLQCQDAELEARVSTSPHYQNAGLEAHFLTSPQCQDAGFEDRILAITAIPRRRARSLRLSIIAIPRRRV